jgi:hypothetical protein
MQYEIYSAKSRLVVNGLKNIDKKIFHFSLFELVKKAQNKCPSVVDPK